jgi:hypothetical protein
MTQEQAYATWWWEEGSGILPLPTEDMEEFAHRITQIAWSNAAYKEREALAQTQEPVALPCCGHKDASAVRWNPFNGVVQCHNCGQTYTPPQRTWVDLTDEEMQDCLNGLPTQACADELEHYENALVQICVKCRSNEWGPLTHKKEILSWFHNFAANTLERGEGGAVWDGQELMEAPPQRTEQGDKHD